MVEGSNHVTEYLRKVMSLNLTVPFFWSCEARAAYSQFGGAVKTSIVTSKGGCYGLPLYIWNTGLAYTWTNRYYDEDANTIECYMLFAELLNQTALASVRAKRY